MPLPSRIELANIADYGVKVLGDAAGDAAGLIISSAGDINGDGIDDFIVGAHGNDSGGTDAGAVYVIFGKAGRFGTLDLATLTLADGFKIQGDAAGDAVERARAAGDINNDGYDDIIIGANLNDAGGADAGTTYVLFGKANGFANLDLTIFSPADGFRIIGHAGDEVGYSLFSYGDYDHDGHDDFIVSTLDAGGTSAFSGTWLIYGKAGGYSDLDLHALSAADGFRLSSGAATPAGDVNGDGIEDIIFGEPYANPTGGGGYSGAAYVVFGKPGGFGTIDFANLGPTDGFRINGVGAERAGTSVASAGDVNGDGFADVLIGAPYHVEGISTGAVYVIFGHAGGFGTIDAANIAPSAGFRIIGSGNDRAGIDAAAAGDVNGDGYGDILVGTDSFGSFNVQAGYAYVVFGRPEGYHDINIGYPGLAPTDGIVIHGTQTWDRAGSRVAPAGDVNGDGVADFMLGASGDDDNPGTPAGAVYIIYGVAADLARYDAFTIGEAQVLSGDLFADNGSGVDANVDGGLIRIEAVNGYAANVSTEIMLASGALLTVDHDGTLTYNPNHLFDAMPAPGSGASNTTRVETFNYTLDGGSMAVVTITITGVDSNDTLQGTAGNDNLFGGVGNDTIYAYGGDDQITGGTGVDTMYGGTGNDAYYVDNAADVVVEAANEGFDTIWSTVSYILAAGTEVEALSTKPWEATDAINLTGNEIGNDIYGNAGANRLDGAGGVDSLFGLEGNDMLIGGTGNDYMYGGAGDDFYFVDSLTDRTFENSGQGYDVVWSTVSYALSTSSEIEVLSSRFWESTDDLILVGSDLTNTIYANAGDNVLNGHGGSDSLFGFGGEDSFLFDSALGPTNIDYIADFSSADDTIVLDRAIFSSLSFGTLAPNAFFVGSAAHDSDDRIVYNSSTGQLYYDADGNGAGAAVQFATLLGTPAISSIDFFAI